MKYYVLYCNYTGGVYEIGYGPAGRADDFFDQLRDKHAYDKYGQSYNQDNKMELSVTTFDLMSDVEGFVSENMGVVSFVSPEDRQHQAMANAKKYIQRLGIFHMA